MLLCALGTRAAWGGLQAWAEKHWVYWQLLCFTNTWPMSGETPLERVQSTEQELIFSTTTWARAMEYNNLMGEILFCIPWLFTWVSCYFMDINDLMTIMNYFSNSCEIREKMLFMSYIWVLVYCFKLSMYNWGVHCSTISLSCLSHV